MDQSDGVSLSAQTADGCLQSLDWTGLDWTTGLSLKLRAYHCTITCDLFVQCMRQNTWCL